MQTSLFGTDTLPELALEDGAELLSALEALYSPELQERSAGLDRLIALDAHRRSPLAASLLASRVDEADMDLRLAVVDALDEVLRGERGGARPPERVREWVHASLGDMRDPQVYALLMAAVASPDRYPVVCHILNACSHAGEALLRILHDRKVDVAVRCLAASATGAVGFLEASTALESLLERLTTRRESQIGMRFAPRPDPEAEVLLPALRQALFDLREASR